MVDEQAKRGESVPLHLHRDDMEPFYVHGFRIESETARYLILTTPRHGQFYRAITLPSRAGGLPPFESIDGSQIKQASKE